MSTKNKYEEITFMSFIESTRRTWNKQDFENDIHHSLLGIADETGELCKAFKKQVGYGQELDKANVIEEIGDVSYFLFRMVDTINSKIKGEGDYLEDFIGSLSDRMEEIESFENFNDIALVVSIPVYYKDITLGFSSSDVPGFTYASVMLLTILRELSNRMGITYNDVLQKNVEKLKIRYPEKFTENDAVNRGGEKEEKERKVLEEGLEEDGKEKK